MYCNFESLHFTDESCIVRCKQCGFYKIAFLNIVISLSAKEYRELHKEVISKYEMADSLPDNARRIFISVPSKDLHLMLSPHEMITLYNMIEEADIESKTQELFTLFQL